MCAGACLCTADTWCATAIIVAIPGAVVSATNKCATALRIFAAKTLSFFAHGDCTVACISTAITRFATAILRAIPGAVVLATNQSATAVRIIAATTLSFFAHGVCTVTIIRTAITRFATAILRAIPGAVVLATNQCAIALKISAAGPLSFMAYCICAGACSAVAWISTAVPLREA